MDRVRVSGSGDAIATAPGAVAISGAGVVQLPGVQPARSYYREQIAQIAATQLLDRDTEMAELAAFCTDPAVDAPVYRWWLAPKWSGKTALMAAFALDPPSGVRVVSFFITARRAGHDTRAAFVDIVGDQLAEILGEPSPTSLPPHVRDSYLTGLLTRATEACRQRNERLVLLVDGLDEDRGTPHDQQEQGTSIAAALPLRLPAGLRVLVSGRPTPRLPGDVPEDHPLRASAVRRSLDRSPHAKVAEDRMLLELDRLLNGDQIGQDLLGLLTAARGGLTVADLAELLAQSAAQVRRRLRSVTSRTFDTRNGHWHRDTEILLLGHEDLQRIAAEELGDHRLDSYRQRLHRWAEHYRDRGWPTDTPEYLLHGYHTLLRTLSDLPRMIDCATDPARHDRQLSASGSDHQAVLENYATQRLLRTRTPIDRRTWVRLALHLDRLRNRGSGMPPAMVQGWAKLGELDKAERLARESGDPASTAYALASVAVEAVPLGDTARSNRLVTEVMATAKAEARSFNWNHHASAVVWAAARTGRWTTVDAVLAGVTDHGALIHALTIAGHTATDAADTERALAFFHRAQDTTTRHLDSRHRAEALASIANETTRAGALDEAQRMLLEAETHTNTYAPCQRAVALATVARVAIATGVRDPQQLLTAAESTAWGDEQGGTAAALAAISVAVAESGDLPRALRTLDDAERLLPDIKRHDHRSAAVRNIATAAVAVGLVDRALAAVGAMTSDIDQVQALQGAMRHALYGNDLAAAEQLARAMPSPSSWNAALASIAIALIDSGEHKRAWAILLEVEASVRGETRFTDPDGLLELVHSDAQAQHPERAEAISAAFLPVSHKARALHAIARSYAPGSKSGNLDRLLLESEELFETNPTGWNGASGFVELATTAQALGRPGYAARLAAKAGNAANSYEDPELRVEALSAIAASAMSTGLDEQGRRWLDDARSIADTLVRHPTRGRTLAAVVAAAATTGDSDAVRSFLAKTGGWHHALRMQSVVRVAVGKLDYESMHALLNTATDTRGILHDDTTRSLHALARLTTVAARVGRRGEAAYFLRKIAALSDSRNLPEDSFHALLHCATAAMALDRHTLARRLLDRSLEMNKATVTVPDVALLALRLDMESLYEDIVAVLLADGRWAAAVVALRATDPTITQLVAEELVRISRIEHYMRLPETSPRGPVPSTRS